MGSTVMERVKKLDTAPGGLEKKKPAGGERGFGRTICYFGKIKHGGSEKKKAGDIGKKGRRKRNAGACSTG